MAPGMTRIDTGWRMHQRTSIELFNYWNQIRGTNAAPLRAQIDPASLPRLLPELFILEMPASGQSQFRLAGTRVCSFFGRELRGNLFASLWAKEQAWDAERVVTGVMTHSVPALIHATGYAGSGYTMAFELLLLPVRSAGDLCDRLLGAAVPVGNAAWLGGAFIEFLVVERSRLLNEHGGAPTDMSDDDDGLDVPSPLRMRNWAQTMLRAMHLKIFEDVRSR
ncbi:MULTISPECIES: PAS domain-containing protein [unclassified Sinorhizobium]|uniref:PAS domain-containing protein n=1 Tax=unclassified Sinorhizobium TaxID=2613772 RepID=UPI003524F10F